MCRLCNPSVWAVFLAFLLQGSQVYGHSSDMKTSSNGNNGTNTILNVLQSKLEVCSLDPLTGWFR